MKKKIPIILLLSIFLCGIGYNEIKKNKKAARKFNQFETSIKLINVNKFNAKLQKSAPLWMQEQIAEDFKEFLKSGISKRQVDATYTTIKKNYSHPWIVRYRVINNCLYRFFPKGEAISLENNDTELVLKTLMRFRSFPDMDFILSYIDGVPLSDNSIPEKFYFTANREEQAPILFPAKFKNTPYVILIPDWRSLGRWWAKDIKDVLAHTKEQPWEKKREFALWRGGLTKSIRLKLCQISSQYPHYLDAKLNVKVEDPILQEKIEQEGLFGGKVSWNEFLACKYLPTLDGVCCAAPAFQWRLLSHSLTLKQESEEIQWFYRALSPYVHYLPIKNDLSDLIEKIEWAKAHDQECRAMTERASEFALNNLMMEDIYLYFHLVMKQYASLQKLDRKELLKEVKADPQWVNIQNRNRLKKEKKNQVGYMNGCSPY